MSRRNVGLLAVVVAFVIATPSAAYSAPTSTPQLIDRAAEPVPDSDSDCNAPALICTGGKIVGGVVGGVIGSGANSVASAAMGGIVAWASEGAAWLVEAIVKEIERGTRPQLDQDWFQQRYRGMVVLAIALSALFLLAATGHAIFAQDLGRLVRAAFISLPCALLLTFAAVTLTQIALRVTDEMTAWVLTGTGEDIHEAFRALGKILVLSGTNAYAAPFVVFLNAVLISVVALVVWLELVMREAAVYVALAFLPLTLIAMVWERTVHWSRRLVEWLLAIVLAKFTIACAFALAASAITEGFGDGGGVTTVLAGSAVLLIAALTPWALLRLLPFAEAAAGNLTRGHVTSAATGVPGAQTATSVARQMLLMRFTSGGMGGSSRAAAIASSSDVASPKPPSTVGGAGDPGASLPQLPDRRPARPRAGGGR